MDQDLEESRALVVSFLQQRLKENPDGISLKQFELLFPETTDEPPDWYKRYKKNSTLQVLECMQQDIKVYHNNRYNQTFISLNLRSSAVDSHLVDLIQNQRGRSNRPRGRPNTRAAALASFSLNQQYRGYPRRPPTTSSTRLNQSFRSRDSRAPTAQFSRQPVAPPRPIINERPRVTAVSRQDPRLRSSGPPARPLTPTTVHHQPPTPSFGSRPVPVPSPTPPRTSYTPQQQPTPAPATGSGLQIPRPAKPKKDEPKPQVEEDPVLVQKKSYVRQKIMSLLTRKFAEIKLLYLVGLYEVEYEETIDPVELGHKNLTSLLQDPAFKKYIQLNLNAPFPTISAKKLNNEKENLSKVVETASAKLKSADPFVLRSLERSLEPTNVQEAPLGNLQIDEDIKFKTMRIIFKAENSSLVIDEWEDKFEQECRLRVQIRDYGFRTPLEFFSKLASELPIDLEQEEGQWVAIANLDKLSIWLHNKLMEGHYRAITSIEVKYELVSFPSDMYNFIDPKDLITLGKYEPAIILSLRPKLRMWLQLRTTKKIEEHLCIESSMTCYDREQDKSHMVVPKYFVKPGLPCAVYDKSQQRWCRVLITEAPENPQRDHEVSALLVDYGVIRRFRISSLKCLLKIHLRLPVGPIFSHLMGVNNEVDFKVQGEVKKVLQEYTSPPVTLACGFLKAVPSNNPSYLPKYCVEVKLMDTRHGIDNNLADAINFRQQNSESEDTL